MTIGTALGATPLWSQQRPDTSKAARDSAMKAMPGMDMPGMKMTDSAMRAMPGMGNMPGMKMGVMQAGAGSMQLAHATPPKTVTYNWNVITLPGLMNPLRTQGDFAANVQEGKRVFFQNCVACHGPALDGKGRFANSFTLSPRQLTDPMFLPMHPEGYVFWRIAKGGWALPSIMFPWNSAMPAFEDILTEREIWAVILFLYEQQGFKPGPWMWTEEQMKAGGAHVHIMQ
ncbi:MAG: cytochrome c [Gemmatimonadetes bacterium]|nr:cytochrome c [Gemmatimonadota bacterium]